MNLPKKLSLTVSEVDRFGKQRERKNSEIEKDSGELIKSMELILLYFIL